MEFSYAANLTLAPLVCLTGILPLQTIVLTSVSLLVAINMAVASFIAPNRVYLVAVGVSSCVCLAADVACLVLSIIALADFGFRYAILLVLPIVILIMLPAVVAVQLTWTIFAFRWVSSNAAPVNAQPAYQVAAAQDENAVLRQTVAQLSATVHTLTARLDAQHAQQPAGPVQQFTNTPYPSYQSTSSQPV